MRILRDKHTPNLECGKPEPIPLPPSEPLKDEMQAFINMVKTNQPAPTDLTEALYVQRLLDRMEKHASQKLSNHH
jgi:predicted dehydrogenase